MSDTRVKKLRICFWCGEEREFTRDHLVPRWARLIFGKCSIAVPVSLLKRVASCRKCNSSKGGMPPALFAQHRIDHRRRKELASEWGKIAHLMCGSRLGPLVELDPVEVAELARAMFEPFTHNEVRYPSGTKMRVPWRGHKAVISIDTATLSKQP